MIESHQAPVQERRVSLAEALLDASSSVWSGDLRVLEGEELVGVIVFVQGEVAWAVARNQPLDLRTMLKDSCGLTQPQATRLRAAAERSGKPPKVDSALEESGLVPTNLYRRCLKKHIRSALSTLLPKPNTSVNATSQPERRGARVAFSLREVLDPPALLSTLPPPALAPSALNSVEKLLEDLQGLQGCQGVALLASDGSVIAQAGLEALPGREETTRVLGLSFRHWSERIASLAGLGQTLVTVLECSEGSLLLHSVGDKSDSLLALVLDRTGRLGVAKHRIATAAAGLQTLSGLNTET